MYFLCLMIMYCTEIHVFMDLVPMDFYLGTAYLYAGNTILNITDFNDQVKQINPSNLYFSYGVNDMGLDLKKKAVPMQTYMKKKVKEVLKK